MRILFSVHLYNRYLVFEEICHLAIFLLGILLSRHFIITHFVIMNILLKLFVEKSKSNLPFVCSVLKNPLQ